MVLTQIDSNTVGIEAELGVSDGEAMLSYDVEFTVAV
jgi:hypothetical protein